MTEKELRERVGKNFARILQRKGLSVQALVDLLGMERSNLSPMEHGRANITLSTLHKLALALEVEPREFFKVK